MYTKVLRLSDPDVEPRVANGMLLRELAALLLGGERGGEEEGEMREKDGEMERDREKIDR